MKTMKVVQGSAMKRNQFYYRATESGIGDVVAVPYTGNQVIIMVEPGVGATAKVEFTISEPRFVEDGTAIWQLWSEGEVTAVASGTVHSGITGVRVTSTGGSTTWEATA